MDFQSKLHGAAPQTDSASRDAFFMDIDEQELDAETHACILEVRTMSGPTLDLGWRHHPDFVS
jgi:hypothetical protein